MNMRFVTPVALALTLALAGGAVSVPAFAAKKEEKKGGAPKLNVSPDVVKALQTAQQAAEKQDFAAAKAALADADSKAKSNDDKYQIGAIKLNTSIAGKDAAMQSEALTQMLDSGLTPPEQAGQFNAVAADQALQAKNYDLAITRAQAAAQAGYKPEAVNVTLAQAYFGKAGTANASVEPQRGLNQQGLAALKAAADATRASGGQVPAQWYQIGVSRAATAKLPEVTEWAKMAYQAAPSGENLRTLIRLFQQANPNISNRENLDVLRLMATSGGLVVAQDYLEYAEMASKTGIYGEVKSAIDAGRGKGVLNASQGGDLYQPAVSKIAGDKGSLGTAEADARKAANGKIAAATADAYLGYGDYAKAAAMFELAKQKGGVDADEINTRMGIAKALGGDNASAKAAFQSVQAGSRKQIADLWLTYLATKA
ncbi:MULTISPECIES: hypothetical protein [Sphingobium]|uniref:TPR repeat protein n=1 Tax=Sphingobium fuliginis (strain ATCC 27551) TaxID=336203 RepID=A0ABQ1EVI3_SPHSA|nr:MULTISPECIES: hypothetical protein [Sphingobium]RYL98741.1 hypothetical protein EWH10_09570 [Sphingobium fuliginis]WDA37548.1 hypothetical protein PO876_04970 [Sphingobium sp. YC-XJ3]GFZ89182.1 hypothetical protein GCM10019071_18760 [Sphingobium fuliginis]